MSLHGIFSVRWDLPCASLLWLSYVPIYINLPFLTWRGFTERLNRLTSKLSELDTSTMYQSPPYLLKTYLLKLHTRMAMVSATILMVSNVP